MNFQFKEENTFGI